MCASSIKPSVLSGSPLHSVKKSVLGNCLQTTVESNFVCIMYCMYVLLDECSEMMQQLESVLSYCIENQC